MASLETLGKDPLSLIFRYLSMAELAALAQSSTTLKKAIYAYRTDYALASAPSVALTYERYAALQTKVKRIGVLINQKEAQIYNPTAHYYATIHFNLKKNHAPVQNKLSYFMGGALGVLTSVQPSELSMSFGNLTINMAIGCMVTRELPTVFSDYHKIVTLYHTVMVQAGVVVTTDFLGRGDVFNCMAAFMVSLLVTSKVFTSAQNIVLFDLLPEHYSYSFYDDFFEGMRASLLVGLPLNLILANSFFDGLIAACTQAIKVGLVTGTISAVTSSISTIKDYLGMRFFTCTRFGSGQELDDLRQEKNNCKMTKAHRASLLLSRKK